MIGLVIRHFNQPGHMSYSSLSKGYVEVSVNVNSKMWRSPVLLVPHGVAQRRRRRSMCFVNKIGQDLLSEDQICPIA
ncbi:hypothetical protein TNCV_4514821 [Trichonephila clavipes]|nr:hypothetical protein TNCV_4514821 [Trichonephila clavipes]